MVEVKISKTILDGIKLVLECVFGKPKTEIFKFLKHNSNDLIGLVLCVSSLLFGWVWPVFK